MMGEEKKFYANWAFNSSLEFVIVQPRSNNNWSPEKLNVTREKMSLLIGWIKDILNDDWRIEKELGPFLKELGLELSRENSIGLLDFLMRIEIILSSILVEAQKHDIDPTWLLDIFRDYCEYGESIFDILVENEVFVPKIKDGSVNFLGYLDNVVDRVILKKNIEIIKVLIEEWSNFLEKTPLSGKVDR